MALHLTSPVFEANGIIPRRHTGEGEDRSVPLCWEGVPDGTRSFALIIDDPDAPDPEAPKMVFSHWVVCNIPADARELPEGASGEAMPEGAVEGENDFEKIGYGGPLPPIGRHRYFHKLYALDTTLDLERPTKATLEQAMEGHVLDEAELVGTFQKGD